MRAFTADHAVLVLVSIALFMALMAGAVRCELRVGFGGMTAPSPAPTPIGRVV